MQTTATHDVIPRCCQWKETLACCAGVGNLVGGTRPAVRWHQVKHGQRRAVTKAGRVGALMEPGTPARQRQVQLELSHLQTCGALRRSLCACTDRRKLPELEEEVKCHTPGRSITAAPTRSKQNEGRVCIQGADCMEAA